MNYIRDSSERQAKVYNQHFLQQTYFEPYLHMMY